MDLLAVEPVIDFPSNAIEHGLGRKDFDRHVGEHELDALKVTDRAIELVARRCIVIGDLGGTNRSSQCVRGDLQASLDEPVLGEFEALADSSKQLVFRNGYILEAQFGMVECEIMHKSRRTEMIELLCRLVDQEQGGLVCISIDMRVYDDKIRRVIGSDKPFFPAEMPAAVLQHRLGLHLTRVGSGIRFGDGEAAAAIDLHLTATGNLGSDPWCRISD